MKKMLQNLPVIALLCILGHSLDVSAQGTAFTYQGRLNNNGAPANGSYDLAFTLYSTNVTGVPVAAPVTNSAVAVTNGFFTTLVDFGNVFNGASNWLEIAVSTNAANSFTTLSPRQQVTPTPYALFAEGVNATGLSGMIAPTNIANGSISSNLLATGSVGVSQLTTNIGVWNKAGTNIFYTNGYVGIGTNVPTSQLAVVGNIQLGAGGTNYAASGTENLRIIRGDITSTGGIAFGRGFNVVSNSVGSFTINFTPAFSGYPTVTVTGATGYIGSWNTLTPSYVVISLNDFSGTPVNQFFNFIAVGPP